MIVVLFTALVGKVGNKRGLWCGVVVCGVVCGAVWCGVVWHVVWCVWC
jgi:hypothetical protein